MCLSELNPYKLKKIFKLVFFFNFSLFLIFKEIKKIRCKEKKKEVKRKCYKLSVLNYNYNEILQVY